VETIGKYIGMESRKATEAQEKKVQPLVRNGGVTPGSLKKKKGGTQEVSPPDNGVFSLGAGAVRKIEHKGNEKGEITGRGRLRVIN